MKNTRREGPGGCTFMMQSHPFSGQRPGNSECQIFSVLPKGPLSAEKTAVRLGRSDCGTECGQRENGKIQRNK